MKRQVVVGSILKIFATCHCNNMVTICPGATKELNTLDRMVHPDVKVGNPAHSGLDGHEVTKCCSSGMNHGKETAIKNQEVCSGAPLSPVPCEEMK